MRVIRVDDEAEYGVALGSILVSLLEPEAGKAKAFNRWYERDHFYAGCMTGDSFFAGRRFVAPRSLKQLRYPAESSSIPDTSIGSFLALYWIERGHHEATEAWAVDRVLWLGENGRMMPGRKAVHASFYRHALAVLRDDDGIPPEVALDHAFPGVVLVVSERPEGVGAEERAAWLLEHHLPTILPGSDAALCLSLEGLALPESSPVYTPPEPGQDRRHLEIYFLESTPDVAWTSVVAPFGDAQKAAGMGEVHLAAGFIPTIPGTDRYVDEI